MAGHETNSLTTRTEDATFVKAQAVEFQSLIPLDAGGNAAPAPLTLKNVVVGVARFDFQGNRWHNFSFDIPVGFAPTRAVVMLALMDIENTHTATNLEYLLDRYSVSYVGTTVRVTGRIFVGDSDGYLRGLSYHCTVV